MILSSRKLANTHNMCLGCGLCSIAAGVEMNYKDGRYVPSYVVENAKIESSCPAKGYDMKKLGNKLFGDTNYRYEIGYYRRLRLAHSNDQNILKNASSGGVMTQIALYLLDSKMVDGVISNRFTYKNNLVRTETFIASSIDELTTGQGSKYCPTSTLSILPKLEKGKKYLLIGTPCQIAGFRMYANKDTGIKEQIPFTIANFCGGYRDFRELDYFVRDVAHIKDVDIFRHRGGGQPGSMRIIGKNGEVFEYPYPKYARLSPYIKNERCTLCMDATGELADFSCGDAWLEKIDTTAPWSIIVVRSETAENILGQIEKQGLMAFRDDVTEDELIYSQKSNITSKKYRQYKRLIVRKLLLLRNPLWNDKFSIRTGSFFGELKIIVSKAKARFFKNY